MPDIFYLTAIFNLVFVIFFFFLQLLYRWATFGRLDAIITYLNAANFALAVALVARVTTQSSQTPLLLDVAAIKLSIPLWLALFMPLWLILLMTFQSAVHINQKRKQDRRLQEVINKGFIAKKDNCEDCRSQEDSIVHFGQLALPVDFDPRALGGLFSFSGNQELRSAYLEVLKAFKIVKDIDPKNDESILPTNRARVIFVYEIFGFVSVLTSLFILTLYIATLR